MTIKVTATTTMVVSTTCMVGNLGFARACVVMNTVIEDTTPTLVNATIEVTPMRTNGHT